jgi:hypothetical protein
VAKGAWGTVECAVRPNGHAPAEEFLNTELENVREKGKYEPLATARARFLVLFDQMADHGRLSGKRFSKEMGQLYAFKHEVRNVQIRFPCFQDGKRWILTHGFFKPGAQKKKGKWPASEVARAEEIMSEYFQRKKEQKTPPRKEGDDKDSGRTIR